MAVATALLYSLGPALDPPIPFPETPAYNIDAPDPTRHAGGPDEVDDEDDVQLGADEFLTKIYRKCLYGGARPESVSICTHWPSALSLEANICSPRVFFRQRIVCTRLL
jgi:hypothetical protein